MRESREAWETNRDDESKKNFESERYQSMFVLLMGVLALTYGVHI